MRNLVIWMKTILRACYRIRDCDMWELISGGVYYVEG